MIWTISSICCLREYYIMLYMINTIFLICSKVQHPHKLHYYNILYTLEMLISISCNYFFPIKVSENLLLTYSNAVIDSSPLDSSSFWTALFSCFLNGLISTFEFGWTNTAIEYLSRYALSPENWTRWGVALCERIDFDTWVQFVISSNRGLLTILSLVFVFVLLDYTTWKFLPIASSGPEG